MTRHASFYVVASAHLFFWLWFLNRSLCQIMVVRAGQPSGWPVSLKAGIPTLVRATTHERRNSSGSCNCYFKEAAIMATTLTPHTLNLSLCLRLSVAQTVIPVSVCFAPSPVMNAVPAVPLSVTMCSPLLPVCRWWRCPVRNKKPLRPSQRVMTPVNTSALRLTISSTAPAPYPSLLGVI